MHDIKYIRENPAEFDAKLGKRNLPAMSAEILALDAKKREKLTQQQEMQARRNSIAKEIGAVKSKGGDASGLLKEAEEIKAKMAEMEAAGDETEALLATIPNLLQDSVPVGKDESGNVEVRRWGTPKQFDFTPKAHYEIGEKLGLLDFDQTAKISGARFYTLKGRLASLERKLADFMINFHTAKGFVEMRVPHLVWANAAYGVGMLPKFGEDMFKTNTGHYLIPTSELPLTNMVNDRIVDDAELPIKYTAHTQCYRSEAGSAGKDTRGMIRVHEFSKVEMVAICKPEDSDTIHHEMLAQAEGVLQALELPYRVMQLCSGDTGFASSKTYDLEVWLPAQNAYREISSVSNCRDFQARRMKARYKKEGKTEFLHTLNGSGLAIGRTIVAILENYQTKDGNFEIPKILK